MNVSISCAEALPCPSAACCPVWAVLALCCPFLYIRGQRRQLRSQGPRALAARPAASWLCWPEESRRWHTPGSAKALLAQARPYSQSQLQHAPASACVSAPHAPLAPWPRLRSLPGQTAWTTAGCRGPAVPCSTLPPRPVSPSAARSWGAALACEGWQRRAGWAGAAARCRQPP